MQIGTQEFIYIFSGLWAITACFDFLDFLYIWQLKEYRWSKILDFAKTKEGITYWLSYPTLFRPFVGLVAFFILISVDLQIANWIVASLLLIDVGYQLYRWQIKKRLRRPKLTARIIVSFIIAYGIEGAALSSAHSWTYLLLLSSVRLYSTSLAVLIAAIPFNILKKIIIKLATFKMSGLKKVTVIGITGSYGKTTVKEFLSHILSATHNVVKTPKHVNTDIGVAMFILKTNFQNKDIFVAEMGADHKGDIYKLAHIARPDIGILTAINEQHLSLFGTIENIQKEKYELLRAVPKGGLAIVNSDNKYCREYLHELEADVQTFGVDKDFSPTAYLKDIHEKPEGITVTGVVHGEERVVFAPIHGAHNALNLGPCALVAMRLGVDMETYQKQLATLAQPEQSLELFKLGQAFIIDDSWNANPTGFTAALDYVHTFPSNLRRIVITRGMVELGDKSSELHERVAGSIAYVADELILTSRDEEVAMKRGLVSDKYKTVFTLITDRDALLTKIKELQEEECVILLENRLPSNVYAYIKEHVTKV